MFATEKLTDPNDNQHVYDMGKGHFVETGRDSFYGEYLYDPIVPKNHFMNTETTDSL
jgi:hypothetical protein